ncbi:MAG: DMT family transporter [Gammaproteobacteria bacterium]|nr:DMT family transporter [Gammaproteobacteria bacterium]MDH3467559.1 DMT family transporter [Gammaproteobacteria bacterium]
MGAELHAVVLSPAIWGVLSAITFGAADFIARFSSRELGHDCALFGTFSVTLLILLPLFGIPGIDGSRTTGELFLLVLHGAALTSALLLLYLSLARGPINLVAPIVAAHPVFVLLVAYVFGARLSTTQLLAATVVIASIVVIVMAVRPAKSGVTTRIDNNQLRKTILIAMAASIVYALMVITGQKASLIFGTIETLTWGHIVAVLMLLLVRFPQINFRSITAKWALILIAQGILNALGLVCLFAGSAGLHPEITAVLSSEFSAVTILLAWWLLKERMTYRQLTAVSALFIGTGVLVYG